jgi:hypothetical protein
MRRQRAFGGTSSPNSVFLGFLDVVSCGFAAALVLAIIFSIVQPAANSTTVPSTYAYFEFLESGPTNGEFQSGHQAILRPIIFYTPPNEQTKVIRSNFKMDGEPVATSEPQLNVTFFGCSSDPKNLLVKDSNPDIGRQYWGVLIAPIPKDWKVDVEMLYCDITGSSSYLTTLTKPRLTLKRTRIPGETGAASPEEIYYGQVTAFGQ